MAYNFSPRIITDGLVLYLDASNTRSYVSGSTIWNDLSRGGNTGTLVNGPTFNSGNGGSIVFDGSNDFVDCGTSSTSILRGGTQFTLNYWFKKFASNTDFLLGTLDDTANIGFFIQWFSDSVVYFGMSNGSRTYNFTNLPYTNNWINFTFTFNGSLSGNTNISKLFINSTQQTLSTFGTQSTIFPNNILNLYIGKLTNYSGIGKGDLSNLQLYNRALSATEIRQNFNATKTRFGI